MRDRVPGIDGWRVRGMKVRSGFLIGMCSEEVSMETGYRCEDDDRGIRALGTFRETRT